MFPILIVLSLGLQGAFHIDLKPKDLYRVNLPTEADRKGEKFELSGLLALTPKLRARFGVEGDFLFINDKFPFIYRGVLRADHKEIDTYAWIDLKKFGSLPKYDIEDIATDGERLFAVHETEGAVYEIKFDPKTKKPTGTLHRWKNTFKNFEFDASFGIEALGFIDGKLWLGKEMPPLAFFTTAPEKFDPKPFPYVRKSGSVTSIRSYQGAVFILDRDQRCVWRTLNVEKGEGQCFSFQKIVDSPALRFPVKDPLGIDHPEWSTAEAMDFKDGDLVIGLDNNSQGLISHPSETRPAIFTSIFPHELIDTK